VSEAQVKEKLTVEMAPPPAAVAADKRKAEKKRSETENLIDGHAGNIKVDRLSDEQRDRRLAKQGRTGGLVGFALLGGWALIALMKRGWRTDGLEAAYHKLAAEPWFFDTTTRMMQFRIFVSLAGVFLLCALLLPATFGRFWMRLGGILGFINTRIILAVVYYLMFTPSALVMRILGRDPLRRAKQDGSYWVTRPQQRTNDHFKHTF
jgi:hypothetical protein